MPKIIITLKDITESGGGERVCVNLANLFSNHGYEVEVISFYHYANAIAYNLDSKVNVIFLSPYTPNTQNAFKKVFFKTIYRYFLSIKTALYINKEHISAVLANDGWFVPLFKNKNTRYIRLWHLNAPKKKRFNLSLFNTLAILSSKELPLWQKLHSNIRVIPNFIPSIRETNSRLDSKIIISIGRLSKEKGFLRLLDIWNLVRQNKASSEWKLIIIGDGILKRDIESKIKDLKLQDSVILKPFTKEIEKEYLESSIYVMSSFFEGFGMVLAEASSFGVPCIAFDVAAGPSDIIEHNKSGYLIEDNNNQDFANKILDLMQDEAKRKAFGKNAKEIIRNKFSKEAILPLWEEVLNGKC